MLTAAITAAVAWILSLFGIKPGAYLVFVAGGVKIAIVLTGVLLGAKVMKKAKDKRAQPAAPASPDPEAQPPG